MDTLRFYCRRDLSGPECRVRWGRGWRPGLRAGANNAALVQALHSPDFGADTPVFRLRYAGHHGHPHPFHLYP